MKHLKSILSAATVALMLSSCGGGDLIVDEIEYYPVKNEKNGKWGLMGSDGEMLVEDEFDNRPSVVIDGIFFVRNNSKNDDYQRTYTLYKADKHPKPIKGCEDLVSVGYCSEGLIPVAKKEKRIQFIDKDGEVKFTLEKVGGKEIRSCQGWFSDGRAYISDVDGKYGFINTKGEVIVKPKYDGVGMFNEGYAFVAKDEKISIIDKDGEVVAKLKSGYELNGKFFIDGLCPVREKDGDRCGFVNTKGEITKAPNKVKYILEWNEDYYIYEDESNKWGLMSMEGEVLVRAKYDRIYMLRNGKMIARNDKKYFFIDANGEKGETLDYEDIEVLPGKGFYMVGKEGSTYVLLDDDGKPVNNKVEIYDLDTFDGDDVYSDHPDAKKSYNDYGYDSKAEPDYGYAVEEAVAVEAPAAEADYYYPAEAAAAEATVADWDYYEGAQ